MAYLPVKSETPPVAQEPRADKNSKMFIIKTLPSGFLSYDVDQIEIRALTLGELKYLHTIGLTNKNLVDLYKDVILNYDVYSLTWSDFSYIVAHIAMFTTESVYWTFPAQCTKCGKPLKIKLSSEHFVQFEDTADLKGYPITVNISGQDLEFGFMTVAKYLETEKALPKVEKHLRSLYAVAAMVTNMDTDEAFEIIKGITDYEESELVLHIAELLFHDSLPIEWKCEHCGHVDKYKVDVEVSTVSPFRDDGKSLDDRINFGVRAKRQTV